MAKILTKTAIAINSAMCAPTLEALDIFENTIVKAMPQQAQRENVGVAIKARQLQLKNAPAYTIKADDLVWLRKAIWIGRYAFEYSFCVDLDCDIFKGRYLVTSDGYRSHFISVGSRMPTGCYHLFDSKAYLIPAIDAPTMPQIQESVSYSKRNFMTKVRIPKGTKLRELSHKIKDHTTDFIRISAGPRATLCTGEHDTDHTDSCWQILNTYNLADAVSDRDATLLLGYYQNEPVVMADSGGRIALLMPCNPPKDKMDRRRERPLDAYHDRHDRRDAICSFAAKQYHAMIERDGRRVILDGQTFEEEHLAMRHFARTMIDIGDLSWYPYVHRNTARESLSADIFDAICKEWQRSTPAF